MAALAVSSDQEDIDSAVWSSEIQRRYNKHELTGPCITSGSLREGCRQVWAESSDTATPLADEGAGRGWGEKGRKRKPEDSVGGDKVRMERRDEGGRRERAADCCH